MRIRPLIAALLMLTAASAAEAKFPARLHEEQRVPDDLSYDDLGDWDLLSGFPTGVDLSRLSDYERGLGSGMHLDTAWQQFTSGDPAVLIAVFDSGFQWDDRDTVNKHYLNRGELPPPQVDPVAMHPGVDSPGDITDCTDAAVWSQSGTEYDVNHDGVFNIRDFRCDSRVSPTDGVDYADGLLDPSDLIHASDPAFLALAGSDGDGNGYVDDISGWDFFWDDNDPYDDTRYSHGTGEARGSGGEADNGIGDPGVCPDCMVLHVRVSDSFVADSNNLAQGIVFAVDNGASVIQSALGPLTGSRFAQAAIDYAFEKNVVAIMSAADETSMHHFPISAGEHTLMVHAVVPDVSPGDLRDSPPLTFMSFSNCTNYGGHLFLSTPSTSCSSGAVKSTAGVAGLLYSYARQHDLLPLTANEVGQLLRAGADDIHDPRAAGDPQRFPSQEGWDQYFGYGRTNAFNSLKLMADGKIPPEAEINAPGWFEVLDPARTPQVAVRGFADAPRADRYTWELAYAPGITPPVDGFTEVIASGEGTERTTEFGVWDLTKVAFDAARDYGPITSADNRTKTNQFTFTLRLRVTDDRGNVGEYRKTVYLRRDPDTRPGFPLYLGNSGEASPKLADLDGDGVFEIIVALADGTVHAYDGAGKLLPGWPATTRLRDPFDGKESSKQISGSPGYASGAMEPSRSGFVATPAVGKLDGHRVAVVAATLDGDLYAFGPDANVLDGFPARIDPLSGSDTNPVQILDDGFFASPVLYDMDGDGTLEIVAAAMDGQVYLFNHTGERVAPFPLEARDAAMDAPDDKVDAPDSEACRIVLQQLDDGSYPGGGYRSRLIATPAVGDIDGDGRPEIVFGTSEMYPAYCHSDWTGPSGSSRLYAFRADGTQPAGFPRAIPNHTSILPFVGRGMPNSVALADLDGDGALDIALQQTAQIGGLGVVNFSGETVVKFNQGSQGGESNAGSGGAFRAKPWPVLINNGSFGDLDGDGVLDFFVGGVSTDMLVSMSNDGVRRDSDHVLLGFSGATGEPLDGFPQVMEDIQFFMNPAIADLDGDGRAEVLNGSGGFVLHAWNHRGERPRGWPKFTGQWLVASPAVGDVDGDGYLDVVVNSRDGWLFAWKTRGPAQQNGKNAVQWAGFHHDNQNTGNASTALALQPGPDAVAAGCSCASGARDGGPGGFALLLLFTAGLRVLRRRAMDIAARVAGAPRSLVA